MRVRGRWAAGLVVAAVVGSMLGGVATAPTSAAPAEPRLVNKTSGHAWQDSDEEFTGLQGVLDRDSLSARVGDRLYLKGATGWTRDGQPIAGETSPDYVVTDTDRGSAIRATRPAGGGTETSEALTVGEASTTTTLTIDRRSVRAGAESGPVATVRVSVAGGLVPRGRLVLYVGGGNALDANVYLSEQFSSRVGATSWSVRIDPFGLGDRDPGTWAQLVARFVPSDAAAFQYSDAQRQVDVLPRLVDPRLRLKLAKRHVKRGHRLEARVRLDLPTGARTRGTLVLTTRGRTIARQTVSGSGRDVTLTVRSRKLRKPGRSYVRARWYPSAATDSGVTQESRLDTSRRRAMRVVRG